MSESQPSQQQKPEVNSNSSKEVRGRPSRRKGGKPPRSREPLEQVYGFHLRREPGGYSVYYTKAPLVEVERLSIRTDSPDAMWLVVNKLVRELERMGSGYGYE